MEDVDTFNLTHGLAPHDPLQSYPTPPFPAWVPAATVAVVMVVFLAGSFYLRHRKVMKKRQILMDYFYIIFQYGGLRRKRMVTSLCNTNAITLRDLGRSFMISCDSEIDNDNSCPFYLDDSPFRRTPVRGRRPLVKKPSLWKHRGMSPTRRYPGPFLRFKAQSVDNPRPYPSSFQDIVMKFRTKRPHGDREAAQSSLNIHNLLAPQFEGCSMSTIHGDEVDYGSCVEEKETPIQYKRQRRNAFVLQHDKSVPRFADVVAEVGRHSLGQVLPERFKAQHMPYSGKRNSEPSQKPEDKIQGPQCGVFHVGGGLLSPSNVVCGSHGCIPNADTASSAFQSFRNSEPTIFVHSPSVDADTSQGWNDIRNRCTNGVVFLKRVPKTGGAPGEFYYEEEKPPPPDRPSRASLSKVSYVPSGNMNDYHNCILSPNKELSTKTGTARNNKGKGENVNSRSSKSKRGKLSLGNLAVSNFNQRIDMASESLHEYEPEQSLAATRGSCDSTHKQIPASRTTWTRLKNVFSGSRAVQSLNVPFQATKALPVNEPLKKESHSENTRWQKFISVLTGFRSLPETKKFSTVLGIPKTSSSYPVGLNVLANSCDDNSRVAGTKADTAALLAKTAQHWISEPCKEILLRTASLSDRDEQMFKTDNNIYYRRDNKRPNTLHLQSRVQSFPEEVVHGHQYVQRLKTIVDATRAVKMKTSQITSVGRQRSRRSSNSFVLSPMALSDSKKKIKSYSFEAGYLSSNGEYRFRQCPHIMDIYERAATPDRLEGNDNTSEIPLHPRRIRSLSPLPEINLTDTSTCELSPHPSNLESVLCHSMYLTPLENCNVRQDHFGSELQSRETLLDSVDLLIQESSSVQNSPSILGQSLLPVRVGGSVPDISIVNACLTEDTKSTSDVNVEAIKCDVIPNHNTVCSTSLQPNTKACPRDTLPPNCYLTPEHRNMSCSTDSVYYDTVSALGTPSPCESRDFLNFSRSPLHSECAFQLEQLACACSNHFHDRPEINKALTKCNTIINSNAMSMTPIQTSLTENVPFPHNYAPSSTYDFHNSLFLEQNDNKYSNPAPMTNHTAQEANLTTTTADEHLSLPPAQQLYPELYVQSSNSDRNSTSSMAGRSYFQSLLTPEVTLNNIEYQNTSSESSPACSRPSTPTRRHSTPSPSPERRLPRRSGHCSPEEIYMANVARLPRMSQRTNCNAVGAKCAIQNVFIRYEDTNCNPKDGNREEALFDPSAVSTSTARTSAVGDYFVQISPCDTIIPDDDILASKRDNSAILSFQTL